MIIKFWKIAWNQCDALQPRQIHNAVIGATLEPDVETKMGAAEQVTLPEGPELEYELMLANVARRKVCMSEALHVKCSSDWVSGHWHGFSCVQTWTPS